MDLAPGRNFPTGTNLGGCELQRAGTSRKSEIATQRTPETMEVVNWNLEGG